MNPESRCWLGFHRASSFRDAPKAQARNPFDHLRRGEMDSGFARSLSSGARSRDPVARPGMTSRGVAPSACLTKCIPHPHNLPVVPTCRTSLALRCRANQNDALACLAPIKRGGSRSSRTLGAGCDGRTSPGAIVSATSGVGADGEVVWSWRSDAGAKSAVRSADDGGNQAWSPRRSRISRKTIVQGMPAVAVYPWLLTPVLSFCTGGHGCNAHPAFPAPSSFSRAVLATTRTHACRENEEPRRTPLSCSAKAGHPVRRGLSVQAPASLEYWIARSSPIEPGTGAGQ
jgi:hypothetical protein